MQGCCWSLLRLCGVHTEPSCGLHHKLRSGYWSLLGIKLSHCVCLAADGILSAVQVVTATGLCGIIQASHCLYNFSASELMLLGQTLCSMPICT